MYPMGNIMAIFEKLNLQNNWGVILLVIGIFIDFSPMKINPIGWIGKRFNSSIKDQVNSMEEKLLGEIEKIRKEHQSNIEAIGKRVDTIEKSQQVIIQKTNENEIRRIRFEIISFSSSLTNKVKHNLDEYMHIFEINDKYHELISESGMKNGQIDQEMQIITNHYQEHRKLNEIYF